MEEYLLAGRSDMRHFNCWWESHLPSWLIIYCLKGSAIISLHFRKSTINVNTSCYISPDLYPSFSNLSDDFEVIYLIGSNDFMTNAFYGIPADFFIAIFQHPFIQTKEDNRYWFGIIEKVANNDDSPFRKQMLIDLIHSYSLSYFLELQKIYGTTFSHKGPMAEILCNKFYSLILKNCKEHREVSYYAERLCISANYLAMIVHRYCEESPKQAISRQVTSEIKYLLIHTEYSISKIARELHFPDSSYMCRYFKKETQIALTNYRRTIKA